MKQAICILLAGLLAACSSIKSVKEPNADQVEGLIYFMPKKDFVVTVTVSKVDSKPSVITAATLGVSPSYPDLTSQFVLKHDSNLVGKNTLNVAITSSGLLTSATSTSVSQVNQALTNLAGSLGRMSQIVTYATRPRGCDEPKVYTFVYSQPGQHSPCGLTLNISPRGGKANIQNADKVKEKEHSGIFYRQDLPYEMHLSGFGVEMRSIVLSPSESKTHFLPIARTFFANNKAEFVFDNGVPTKYFQDTDGELVGLFKLPADIIEAYFSAVGAMFDGLSSNDQKEAAALTESLKLELARQKHTACMSALRNKDDQAVKDLGCSQ